MKKEQRDFLDLAAMIKVFKKSRTGRKEPPMRSKTHIALVMISAGALVWLAAAQQPDQKPSGPVQEFDVREVLVPMRDGIKLHTMIYTPKQMTQPLPIIMNRTPYGIAGSAGRP